MQPLQGYFTGYVKIGDAPHQADALITVDGLVHIHVDGSPQDPVLDSVQLIGQVVADASQATGTGITVGQGCALASGRFCAETASSEISFTLSAGDGGTLSGEIGVETSVGDETWQLTMRWASPWDTYLEPATLASAEGLYDVEGSAEFAHAGDTVMRVDAAGGMFFQSPSSGCVGNGTLAPHLDGAFSVYDVKFTLEICSAEFAYLNGEFEGLATIHSDNGEDIYLVIYLASVQGAASPTAVTLWALLWP